MKTHSSHAGILLTALLALAGCAHAPAPGASSNTAKLTPSDLSAIRGANYRGAGAADATDYWRHYNASETERDLTYADRLKLNQLRVFVNYASWQADKAAFRRNLVDLARACNRHHIGLMITVGESQTFIGGDGAINAGAVRDFVTELVGAIGDEPALAFWDASNEPDYNGAGAPTGRQEKRFEIARLIAARFHELDKKTPVTIGVANERAMETLADAVDVLSFHDYLSTRAGIADDIARAKAFAAKSGKKVMDTETGCIARANPYDVTLEEHIKARWHRARPGNSRGDVRAVPQPLGQCHPGESRPGRLGQDRHRRRAGVAG
jgi:chorismate mutase